MVNKITTAPQGRYLHAMAIAAMVLVALVFAGCNTGSDVPPQEQRVQDLSKGIMCPVCPGESIDQSQHPLSLQMRDLVREQVGQGRTDSDIKSFFVERYGPSVLLEPPRSGLSLLVWVVPVVAVALAVIIVVIVVRGMTRPKYASATAGPTSQVRLAEDEKERYIRRIEAAIESNEGKK